MELNFDYIARLTDEYLIKMLDILRRTSERFNDDMPNAKAIIEIRISAFEEEAIKRGLEI